MDSLKKKLSKIDNKLRLVATDYSRKIVDRPCNDLNMLNSSLMYRTSAISFHLDLIGNYLEHYSDRLAQPDSISLGPPFSNIEGMRMNYLFDDLVFNLVSYYDYFATFGTYVFYGEEIRNEAKGYDPLNISNEKLDHLLEVLRIIDWNNFAKLANEDPNRKANLKYDPKVLQCATVAKIIVRWNSEFVYNLRELRNDIIHNKVTPVSNSFSFNPVDGGKYEFSIHGMFAKKFPDVDNKFEDALKFLITSFVDSNLEILECLEVDIESNRVVDRGEEWIKFKSEME